MLYQKVILISLCALLHLEAKTLEKQPGYTYGLEAGQSEWSQKKWDSIFKHYSPKDYSYNLNIKDSFSTNSRNIANSNSKSATRYATTNLKEASENEVENLTEDEVFMQDVKNHQNERGAKLGEYNFEKNKIKDPKEEVTEVSDEKREDSSVCVNQNFTKSTAFTEMPKLGASTDFASNDPHNLVSVDSHETKHKLQEVTQNFNLNQRSFIFNPSAQPQEQFQNCTTPKNESGKCRYLQHCLIPSIVSSLGQFLQYTCIIQESFIGVCCPHLPVTVIVIQNKEQEENKTEWNGECGVSSKRRIVGGSKADPRAWPWLVALFSKSKKNFFCGGALINNRYVLTAAHCTFGVPDNKIVARLGEYDFKDDDEIHDDYLVSEIKRHGHYNSRLLNNDIALLKLEKPVVFNEFIQTICFPEEENSYVGDIATLAGWGNTGGGFRSNLLLEASFPVVSNEECEKDHGVAIPHSLICTSSRSGEKGACNGDSGGPLMLLDDNNRWKTIGIVSWGRRGCSPKFPTVYTRVSHFMDWIKEHSK